MKRPEKIPNLVTETHNNGKNKTDKKKQKQKQKQMDNSLERIPSIIMHTENKENHNKHTHSPNQLNSPHTFQNRTYQSDNNDDTSNLRILVNNELISWTKNFFYLGNNINHRLLEKRLVKSRINKANVAFNNLHKVWKKKNISTKTKMKIYEACIFTNITIR